MSIIGKEPTAEPLALAIDTSSPLAGVAVSRGDTLLASLTLGLGKPHSQILFPAVQTITEVAGVDPAAIDVFAAVTGPGGFTGLRVGLSAIMGLADGYGKPAIGVTTFDLIALSGGGRGLRLITISAGRGEVYCGLREILDSTTTTIIDQDRVAPRSEISVFYQEALKDRSLLWIHDDAEAAWGSTNQSGFFMPRDRISVAATLARIAAARYRRGELTPFSPYYIRRSDAELKRIESSTRKNNA